MLRKFWLLLITLTLVGLAVITFLLRAPTAIQIPPSTFASRPDFDEKMPALKISYLQSGEIAAWEAFVKQGGKLLQRRTMPLGALWVQHPKGNLLIDAGLGRNFEKEWANAPWWVRSFFPLKFTRPLGDYQKTYPRLHKASAILLTHAHWDHLSGAKDLPAIPIYLLPEESTWVENLKSHYNHGIFPDHLEAITERIRPIKLQAIPYENFSQSYDWFGDGSVVLVSLPGHTPGSLGIFLNVKSDQRYLIVGDALWGVDEDGKPESRSLLAEFFSDTDRTQARKTRARLRELVEHSNEITLVPVHDSKALANLSPQK